jgi:hypothetical protein
LPETALSFTASTLILEVPMAVAKLEKDGAIATITITTAIN